MEIASTSAPPRRRSRWLKILIIGFILLVGLIWFAPGLIATTSLKNKVLRELTAKLNGTVHAGGMSLGWLRPIELNDVTVFDAAGKEVLTASSIHVSKSLWNLLQDRTDFGTITVTKPTLTVVFADRTNIEELLREFLKKEASGRGPSLVVEVTDGRVLIANPADSPASLLEHAAATLTVPKEGPIDIKVRADGPNPSTPGQIELMATLGTQADGSANVDTKAHILALDFPLDGLLPMCRRFVPGSSVGGRLTADLTMATGGTTSLSGRAEVSGLDMQSPRIGPDRIKLSSARIKFDSIDIRGETITVGPGTELTCDVGTLSVGGGFSPSETADQLIARHGLSAKTDLDLAKLAQVAPQLLHIRPGTEIVSGRVKAEVASVLSNRGVGWKGKVETTALKGLRDGQALGWEQPFRAVFDVHLRPNGLPEFDDFQCQSDFVGLHARGSINEFVVRANLDLDKLTVHLGQFVDFGGMAFAGNGSLAVDVHPQEDGRSRLSSVLQLTRFQFRDKAGRELKEPSLSINAQATGRFTPGGPIPLESLTAIVSSLGDQLKIDVVQPIPDLRAAAGGDFSIRLAGDVGRWAGRSAPFLNLPPGLEVGGNADASGTFTLTSDGMRCPKFVVDVTPFRFRGFGLNFNEPQSIHCETGLALAHSSGVVNLTDFRFDSGTARVFSRRIDLAPQPNGGLSAKGSASVTADIVRVRQMVNLPIEVAGLAKVDRLDFDLGANGSLRFDVDGSGESFVFGSPDKPVWTESRVHLTAGGVWDPKADGLQFDHFRADRDGLTAEAKGAVRKMSTPSAMIDVAGTLDYDLARLEPKLKAYLGKDARAVGKERRPFKLSGPLGDGGRNVAMTVGPFDRLSGSAGLGWQQLSAHGFDVGRAELTAALADGTVRMSPIKATFGGGTIDLSPSIRLDPDYTLTLAPGRIVTDANLTPAVCANAIGFVLPPLANAADVSGQVSLDLEENRIPLSDPTQMVVAGTITVHKATMSPGPLFREVAAAMETQLPKLTLTEEQAVPFRVEKGRVYHKQFKIMVEKTEVRTSGSVGLDGTLSILVEMQVPPRLAQQLFPNNPIARESLAKQVLRFPVTGTLANPKLEPGAVRAAMRGVAGEATRDGLGEFLRRGSERLLQDLNKKSKPPDKK